MQPGQQTDFSPAQAAVAIKDMLKKASSQSIWNSTHRTVCSFNSHVSTSFSLNCSQGNNISHETALTLEKAAAALEELHTAQLNTAPRIAPSSKKKKKWLKHYAQKYAVFLQKLVDNDNLNESACNQIT